jgi:hypothetical protein
MKKLFALLSTCVVAVLAADMARADADFTDPSGDSGGAPDVTDVSVFNDAFNRVVFGAQIAGGAAMAADGEINFVVDADKNAATGSDGWDYLIVMDGNKQWNLLRWDGSQWAEAPAATVKTYFLGDVVLFGVDRSELGNTATFDFFVVSNKIAADEVVATDTVPDGDAVWSYATVTKTFDLSASPIIAVTKGGARVGRAFVAGYLASRTDSPEPISGPKSTCVATVGLKRIPARVAQEGDVAVCRVTVPKTAKGKVLKLTIATTAGGKTVRKSYSTKIR